MQNDKDQEEFDEIYFNELGMCGCGMPLKVKEFMLLLLKNHKAGKDEEISFDEMSKNRGKIIKDTPPDVIFEYVFHTFEKAGLVEHGGSVYGSWFTDKGENFIRLLQQSLDDGDE